MNLSVFNPLGQLIVEESLPVDNALVVQIDAGKMAEGLYIVMAEAGSFSKPQRVLEIAQ